MCLKCQPLYRRGLSFKEQKLYNFIKEIYSDTIIQSDRTILKTKEIDIYLPDIKLGIEFNGLYRHCELHKENSYHYEKSNECLEKGIRLINIWEDDWDNKKTVIQNKLRILN